MIKIVRSRTDSLQRPDRGPPRLDRDLKFAVITSDGARTKYIERNTDSRAHLNSFSPLSFCMTRKTHLWIKETPILRRGAKEKAKIVNAEVRAKARLSNCAASDLFCSAGRGDPFGGVRTDKGFRSSGIGEYRRKSTAPYPLQSSNTTIRAAALVQRVISFSSKKYATALFGCS